MKKALLSALLVLSFASVAGAQQLSANSYEFIMAKMAASAGHFDEALALLDKVIARDPDNRVLLYEHAMIQIDAQRLPQAETELRKVVVGHPDFYEAQRILGRLLLDRAGNDRAKNEEALQHLQAAFKLDSNDISTGMAVAGLLANSDKLSEAEKVMHTLVERSPDQRGINFNYALILTKLGRGDESKQYLERAVLIDPTYTPAIMQLVDIDQKEGEWQKAADLLSPLIEDDPLNLELQRRQAFFYLRANMTEKARAEFKALVDADPNDTRSQFFLAEALNDLERYDEADKIYRQLLEKTPDDPDLLSSYGVAQLGQHRLADAKKTFETMLTLKDIPDNLQAQARTQLAYIALQSGDYDTAITQAKSVLLFRDQPNSEAIGVAVDALKRQKKYHEGVTLLQPLVDKYSADSSVNGQYIELLARAGEAEKARQSAATFAKFGTKSALVSAEALLQAESYADAIALLKREVASKPDDLDVALALGSAYERSGDNENAEKIFLAILAKNPDHVATLNYLGYMWAENGVNLDRAAEMLTRAVTHEPHNGAFIDSLGWVYFRQGKLELAEKYLTDATHLLPNDATVREHLGDVLAKRGDVERALTAYRTALTLDAEPKDDAKIRSKIAALEKHEKPSQR